MSCTYGGEIIPEGSYICIGNDKYVCFEGRLRLAEENAPECITPTGCSYQGVNYPEGSYVCMGEDKYVCFEGRWQIAEIAAPECGATPGCRWEGVDYPEGSYICIGVQKHKCVAGEWICVDMQSEDCGYVPPPPPPTCLTDADCPAGYKCVNGKCIKEAEREFPWMWVALGVGAAIAGALVLLRKK